MKICPSCGGEFQDWAGKCPDCGLALRAAQEMPVLPDGEEGVSIHTGSRSVVRRLSAALRAEGIPARIAEESADLGLGMGVEIGGLQIGATFDGWTNCLYVSSGDAAKAEQITDRLLGRAQLAPPPIVASEGQCPACGAPVGDKEEECPACSLVIPREAADTAAAEPLRTLD